MTVGNLMFYGGIAGVVLGVILIIVCVNVFPRQRKKMLDKLRE